MKKAFPTIEFENIEKSPEIRLKTESDDCLTISQEKVHYRRLRVNKLRLQGYTNQQIAEKIDCNLSTIEKDLHEIRKNSREWFESESITDYCYSLYDSIMLYDCVIEELRLLYENEERIETRLEILKKITEFDGKKLKLFEKTKSVQDYLSNLNYNISVNELNHLPSENEVLSDLDVEGGENIGQK